MDWSTLASQSELRPRPSMEAYSANPHSSGVATHHKETSGSGPPNYVQTPPEISTNPLKSFFYICKYLYMCIGPTYIYCNLLLLTSKDELSNPHFFGLAMPLSIIASHQVMPVMGQSEERGSHPLLHLGLVLLKFQND